MPLPAWRPVILLASLLIAGADAAAEAVLGDNQRITSTVLGYDLQYRVYRSASTSADDELPTLYVTDGQWYLEPGGFDKVLDEAVSTGLIEPVLVVFLDSRNPDNLGENRRNAQFMCNEDFARFFATELVPTISREQSVSPSRDDRVILGVSFGGLNAACFGLMLSDLFSGIAMQSPAAGAHVDIVRKHYADAEPLPLRMFLSVGTKNDNYAAVRDFRRTLAKKGYELTFIKVHKGHDWENWGPLLDDVLVTFFRKKQHPE